MGTKISVPWLVLTLLTVTVQESFTTNGTPTWGVGCPEFGEVELPLDEEVFVAVLLLPLPAATMSMTPSTTRIMSPAQPNAKNLPMPGFFCGCWGGHCGGGWYCGEYGCCH